MYYRLCRVAERAGVAHKEPRRLVTDPGVTQHVHDFPNRDTMTQYIGLAPSRAIAKSDARKFLFERFLLQVNAAESGDFQMATLCLPRKQRGMDLVNSTTIEPQWA